MCRSPRASILTLLGAVSLSLIINLSLTLSITSHVLGHSREAKPVATVAADYKRAVLLLPGAQGYRCEKTRRLADRLAVRHARGNFERTSP